MKGILTAVVLVGCVGAACAGDEYSILYKCMNGDVTFNHKNHQRVLDDCKKCHDGVPGTIPAFDRPAAHTLCKGCHERMGAPSRCIECHIRANTTPAL